MSSRRTSIRSRQDDYAEAPSLQPSVSYSYFPAGQVSNVVSLAGTNSYSLDAAEATRHILAGDPDARIRALSTHDDPVWVRSMFEAGARGFILKESGIEILQAAIEAVAADKYFTDPAVITDVVTRDYVRQIGVGVRTVPDVLTQRQREVLRHVAEGCPPSLPWRTVLREQAHGRRIRTNMRRDALATSKLTRRDIVRDGTTGRPAGRLMTGEFSDW